MKDLQSLETSISETVDGRPFEFVCVLYVVGRLNSYLLHIGTQGKIT